MNKSEQSLLAQVAKRPDLFEDSFYSFAKLMHPRFYLDDREYLIDMCNRLQAFIYGSDKRFLVMTVPPRHGKSLTAQNLTAWLFGLDSRNKVMTGSYNERLSGIFARSVRNMIQTEGVGNNIVYGDIFPDTKVKYGEASASMWSLAGSDEVNYLATSPGATATGLGVNCLSGDTLVTTTKGQVTIASLHNDRNRHQVLTYNHETNKIEVEKVVATKKTKQKQLYELTLDDGTSIRATAEHKFWTQHGYKTVDWIMRKLQSGVHKETLRGDKTRASGDNKQILFKAMPTRGQCEETEKQVLQSMSDSYTENESILLFKAVSHDRRHERTSTDRVSFVREEVPASVSSDEILLNGVQEQVPQPSHGRQREQPLQRRPSLQSGIPQEARLDKREGRQPVQAMSVERYEAGCSPQEPRQARQSGQEPNYTMSLMPYGLAQIKKLELEDVYDIQTERNHNFLANDILTHNCLIIDDIIKSADEAYNENRLQDLWEWYNNTMMQRLEGDWRVIIIMTRWATGDLAGRVLADYGDKVEHISYSAVQPDGSMLCDAVLDAETFALKTQEMNPDIIEANYNQKPIDIRGRLYPTLNTYELETLVETDAWKNAPVQAICDTADAGTDYLCLMAYKVIDNEAYIIDTVFTQEDMDTTEELVADSLYLNDVKSATFEANNGGRLFSKNVEKRIASKYGTNKTVIETVTQSSNKEARIMTSSAWVNKHVYMPIGWRNKWRDLHDNITSYQAKGKNKHDDGADVLAYLFENITDKKELVFYGSLDRGAEPGRGVFSR